MPINHVDKSMFPGWTMPWYEDGSGWTASDVFSAREEGWNLLIRDDQITPYATPQTGTSIATVDSFASMDTGNATSFYAWSPLSASVDFMPKLLEKAMTGNKTAYKALYLMAYNDRRWKDYIPTVLALKEDYGSNNTK